MMKFIIMIFFMNFMLVKNKVVMFYYNLLYLASFGVLFMYMYKDMVWGSVSFMVCNEYYSIWLVMLSIWIISLMLMCLVSGEGMKMFVFINLLMLMMLFFLSSDLMMFYLMFEISLIPTFVLIVYWGSNFERVSASYYLMVYMMLVSFPLLVYVMNMYNYMMTLKFSLMMMCTNLYTFSFWGYMLIYMAFFIKMPMYFVHLWLPKAHVEAPVYGSMILAGVLLKMGSYGLVRLLELFFSISVKYNYLIFSVSIMGSVLVGVLCLTQVDMKSLVAYSSVVHMNMMLCSLMTLFKVGFLGGYIMMISHGLCSSGMFYMVNLYYSRTSSRLLIFNKGMMSKVPSLMMWWFLLSSANFSFPLSLNFFSELYILSVVLNWDFTLMVYLMLVCFFSGAYSLYLFSYVQHGSSSSSASMVSVVKSSEFIVLIMHFYPLIMFLFNLILFMYLK